MILTSVHVTRFRNIVDSTDVKVQPDVTCLVGKNESGKTSFLQALYRLNPARPNAAFDIPTQYPAWLEKLHRRQGANLEELDPVVATFALETADKAVLTQHLGADVVKGDILTVGREYSGHLWAQYDSNQAGAVSHVLRNSAVPSDVGAEAAGVKTFADLKAFVEVLKSRADDEPAKQAATSIEERITATLGTDDYQDAVLDMLLARIPRFFYYGDYSSLPGIVKIRQLLEADPKTLDDDSLTARALLRLAAADNDYLLNPDYELRKRELENVANAMTTEVLEYWTQNPELRVQIDITKEVVPNPKGGQTTVLDELRVRMYDHRHWLSLPFGERSTGFRWFFSFLAAFSEYEFADVPVVILLDEPALGLHARAQRDFLRFIEERLVTRRHQVLYTTHSPFMIQPGKLERVRIVEDRGIAVGAVVTQDIMATDPDTLFPLQGALGYDLAQHLFVGPHNLVVEGTSDYTYFSVVSDFLKGQNRPHLDDRWSIVPVGGADLIPTFVALLGGKLDVTVVVDARTESHQRLSRLADAGYLSRKRVVALGEVLSLGEANVEDVFVPEDYLEIFNASMGTTILSSDLTGSDSITNKIARHLAQNRYDHGRPADALLRRRDELLPKLSEESLKRFELVFERINSTLPQ